MLWKMKKWDTTREREKRKRFSTESWGKFLFALSSAVDLQKYFRDVSECSHFFISFSVLLTGRPFFPQKILQNSTLYLCPASRLGCYRPHHADNREKGSTSLVDKISLVLAQLGLHLGSVRRVKKNNLECWLRAAVETGNVLNYISCCYFCFKNISFYSRHFIIESSMQETVSYCYFVSITTNGTSAASFKETASNIKCSFLRICSSK